jgi:hypothetical protein
MSADSLGGSKVVVDDNDNVGIGTAEPDKKLHIHASPNLEPKSSEGKVQIESPCFTMVNSESKIMILMTQMDTMKLLLDSLAKDIINIG